MKEISISLYLGFFKIFFSFFKLFPLENKTVFISTYGDNAFYLAKELTDYNSHRLIFINSKKCKRDFSSISSDHKSIYHPDKANIADNIRSVYHMATSKYIFVDTYVGALSAIRFKKQVTCVQLWHAAGAIKKFGWSDPEETLEQRNDFNRYMISFNGFL